MFSSKHYITDINTIPSAWIFENYLVLPQKLTGQSVRINSLFNLNDKTPSMYIYYNAEHQVYKYKCFSTGKGGGAIDLMSNVDNRLPLSTYHQSLADQNTFEGLFKGESSSAFPHITHTFKGKDKGVIRKIPAGNTLTLQVATTCINEERMGTSNTDFICISLSSTDYIGHQYAPNSVEIEDTYIRLDKDIATFFQYLDKSIGKGQYLVFLTADHGGAHNASYLQSEHIPAGIADDKESLNDLKNYLITSFGKDSMVLGFENYQIIFNEFFRKR